MAYQLTAHDRGVIAAWKPGGAHVVFLCPEHGVLVEKVTEQTGACWCGQWCVEYKPEDYAENKVVSKKGKVGKRNGADVL